MGLTLHNGTRKASKRDEKELDSDLLFREALEVGYQIKQHQSLSIFFFHISNAGIYSENDGMNHLGIRNGYTF
ncbi:MAG: acyloxyacyl hydrolase [Deltaproteobacteria bacterium]|nr:acyloxyacyl hydrolase [Deltaproteobacteria bacterium]